MRNHGNGECNFILKVSDGAAGRVLVQWQHLLLQLVDAFFQQKQLTWIHVDLCNITTHRHDDYLVIEHSDSRFESIRRFVLGESNRIDSFC